jgi:hypothetical protein
MPSVTSTQASFAGRNGNLSESMFRVYAKTRGFSIERYGFDRTDLDHFYTLPSFIRHTPDFVVTHQRRAFFVECKAGGNDDTVNFIESNIPTMAMWNAFMPMWLFFNDSKHRQIAFLSLDQFASIYYEHKPNLKRGAWQSGAEYVMLPKTLLTWTNYRDF